MPQMPTTPDKTSHQAITPTLAVAFAVLLAALFAASALAAVPQTKVVAKEAENTTLGKRVLTTTKGRTLYSLSAEKKGRFICTGGCLMSWKPLVVAKGVKPKGPVKLGTVMRPDGRRQVTFKGLPLYSFDGDTQKGDANGEGIKDIGTWHAAVTGTLAAEPQPQPEAPNPYSNPPSGSESPHPPYPY
jgi:predicted lipoprotein with Yx(FWY)xxD motif